MHEILKIIGEVIIGLVVLTALGMVLWRWLQRSDDPAALIFKWMLSAGVLGGSMLFIHRAWGSAASGGSVVGNFGPAGLIAGTAALCGLILGIIWAPHIGAAMARPITSAFDGGNEEPEARPFYSIARALRIQGKHTEAADAVRQQLERFPNDFEGILLLASIEAENFKDLPAAETTLNGYCEKPANPSSHVAAAQYQLADWHLKYSQDPEAARCALQTIIDRYPDTEMAAQAAQRIAHLPTREHLISMRDPEVMDLAIGIQNLGLLRGRTRAPVAQPVEKEPGQLAAEYVQQLEQHPFDTEAREKLAVIYAGHFGRLDLATDQIEELLRAHAQVPKLVARWLNLLADLQVKSGADYGTVRATLQRIIDLFPDAAIAEPARNRIDHLRLEFKGKEKSQAVPLGSYEQNLGLKRKRERAS